MISLEYIHAGGFSSRQIATVGVEIHCEGRECFGVVSQGDKQQAPRDDLTPPAVAYKPTEVLFSKTPN